MMRLFYLLFILLIVTGCKSSENSSSQNELSKQNRRDKLCGVEKYKIQENKICGTIYLSKRSSSCGVESYKNKPNTKCTGYKRFRKYTESVGPNDTPHCKSGYKKVRQEKVYENRTSRSREGSGSSVKVHVKNLGFCEKPEIVKSCRRKEHGVEAWKSCRHRNHGMERYHACARPEHGVSEYKKCEFYKNPEEAVAFAERIEHDLPMMRDNLIIHRGNFYSFTRNEAALGGTIKRYESDPLYAEIVAELKLKLGSVFGRQYNPDLYTANDTGVEIENYNCADEDTSNVCRAVWGYQSSRKWFTENIKDLELIRNEMTKFKQMEIYESIATIIEHLQKPIAAVPTVFEEK